MNKIALAIHGGAGTIRKSEMTAELENEYRAVLEQALKAGWNVLQSSGGTALDAVEAAVVCLENDPHFNAGRGSVFTSGGENEMDASIMDGKTLEAGAVAFVRNIKNPIKLARLIMEQTEHVLLAGSGANEFAKEAGAEFAPDDYFFTDFRYRQLLAARSSGRVELDHSLPGDKETGRQGDKETRRQGDRETGRQGDKETGRQGDKEEGLGITRNPKSQIRNPKSNKSQIPNPKSNKSLGTVGAVACDVQGNLAAATSTGGMTNKKFGRVGDTPIIGAGTFADNATCAVSCTGHGEYFMKAVSAFDVSARIKYKGLNLREAAQETIEYLTKIGGEGGLIAVDALGNVALPFNCEGMYRGFMTPDGRPLVEIYG